MSEITQYFTVIVPYIEAKRATQWHPSKAGDAASRGSFPTADKAQAWAALHIPGVPYGITEITYGDEIEETTRVIVPVPEDASKLETSIA